MKPYSGGIRHDYKDAAPLAVPASPQRRWSWFALGLALPLTTVTLFLISEPNQSKLPSPREVVTADDRLEPASAAAYATAGPGDLETATASVQMESVVLELTADPVQATTALLNETSAADETAASLEIPGLIEVGPPVLANTVWLDLLVSRGDTLEVLFRRNGLSIADLAAMVALPDAARHLRLLKPGDAIRIEHEDGRVVSLDRELDEIDLLSIRRSEQGFEAQTISRDAEIRTVGAHGVIRSSLFEAAVEAGIPDSVTMDMAGIFQWDIDFIQDVRVGDAFTVIHEELWRDGEKLRNGSIVAAEFVNRGRSYRAARFEDADGRSDYYTPEGRSVRKAFIRAPVDFTRISSNFNPNRRHPVLNTIRAHRGVDYAAPTGTPVKAAGDGKVQFRGQQGGYGNVVILQHGGNITTLYGHLSRFAKPGKGSRVKQGDIIGYVGSSGLATGPHLHYEYRIAGVHRNPRTVELPAADPVPAAHRESFERATAGIWQQLDAFAQTRLADNAP